MDTDSSAPPRPLDDPRKDGLRKGRAAERAATVATVHEIAGREIRSWGPKGATPELVQKLAERLEAECRCQVDIEFFPSTGEVSTIYLDGRDIRERLAKDPCPEPGTKAFRREQRRMLRSLATARACRSRARARSLAVGICQTPRARESRPRTRARRAASRGATRAGPGDDGGPDGEGEPTRSIGRLGGAQATTASSPRRHGQRGSTPQRLPKCRGRAPTLGAAAKEPHTGRWP